MRADRREPSDPLGEILAAARLEILAARRILISSPARAEQIHAVAIAEEASVAALIALRRAERSHRREARRRARAERNPRTGVVSGFRELLSGWK